MSADDDALLARRVDKIVAITDPETVEPTQAALVARTLFPPTPTAHWLDLTISGSGWVEAGWRCPHTYPASCRSVCLRSECEEGCQDPELHEQAETSYCNVTTWLADEDWQDVYVGPSHSICGGWIEPRWTGHRYGWTYLDAPHEGTGWSGPLRCVLSDNGHEDHWHHGIHWQAKASGPDA